MSHHKTLAIQRVSDPHTQPQLHLLECLLLDLIERAPGVLSADMGERIGGEVPISFTPRRGSRYDGEVLAWVPRREFRTLLALFGRQCMANQRHAGHAQRVLTAHRRRVTCAFFMSNSAPAGFWLQVFAGPNRAKVKPPVFLPLMGPFPK